MFQRNLVERDKIQAGENWNLPGVIIILGAAKLLSVGFRLAEVVGKGARIVKRELITTFRDMDKEG